MPRIAMPPKAVASPLDVAGRSIGGLGGELQRLVYRAGDTEYGGDRIPADDGFDEGRGVEHHAVGEGLGEAGPRLLGECAAPARAEVARPAISSANATMAEATSAANST